MSRSYKKSPFSAIAGGASARYDKKLASHGVRAAHRGVLRRMLAIGEEMEMPHRYECSHNEIHAWGRDGSQVYMKPSASDWERYLNGQGEWPPRWFAKMMRK